MKIFNFGLNIEPGKYKYRDSCFDKLVERLSPQKSSPYTVEFIIADSQKAEAVVFDKAKRLDLILGDLEIIEKRLTRCQNPQEKSFFERCQKVLEEEKLLCDEQFSEEEREFLKTLPLLTFKPCTVRENAEDINALIKEVMVKAGFILFFTIAKKEVRAWSLKKGLSVLEAAGKIHSDLKRGFIKAEIVNCSHLDEFFNMAEARARGFVKTVDKDYIVEDKDIIEIKFNV